MPLADEAHTTSSPVSAPSRPLRDDAGDLPHEGQVARAVALLEEIAARLDPLPAPKPQRVSRQDFERTWLTPLGKAQENLKHAANTFYDEFYGNMEEIKRLLSVKATLFPADDEAWSFVLNDLGRRFEDSRDAVFARLNLAINTFELSHRLLLLGTGGQALKSGPA